MYAPRLLVWPQLVKDDDAVLMRVPGEAERVLYQTEPLYTIGTIFGIAEGDWAVFTEVPAQAGSPEVPQLVAIWLPRGSIYKHPIPQALDTRYAYASRLFGFPTREGEAFHWLILPASGAARFGTITPDRGIQQLMVDGPRLVAKTIDPKNFRGTSAIAYIFYGVTDGPDGLPTLRQIEQRLFPGASEVPYYDAEEAFWHPEYTVLAGRNRRAGDASFVALLPATSGPAKGIHGRILGYADGVLTILDPRDRVNVIVVKSQGGGKEMQFTLTTHFDLPLKDASTLGRVVWITGAWAAGTQVALDLQVQLPGQSYTSDSLGTGVIAVWDLVSKQPVMQLAAVGTGRPL